MPFSKDKLCHKIFPSVKGMVIIMTNEEIDNQDLENKYSAFEDEIPSPGEEGNDEESFFSPSVTADAYDFAYSDYLPDFDDEGFDLPGSISSDGDMNYVSGEEIINSFSDSDHASVAEPSPEILNENKPKSIDGGEAYPFFLSGRAAEAEDIIENSAVSSPDAFHAEIQKLINSKTGENFFSGFGSDFSEPFFGSQAEEIFSKDLKKDFSSVSFDDNSQLSRILPAATEDTGGMAGKNPQPHSRTVNVNLNGSGKIKIQNSTDRQSVISIMNEQLKNVLLSILEEEIFLEGEGSYDF